MYARVVPAQPCMTADSTGIPRHHGTMRKAPGLLGLALVSTLAFAACSSTDPGDETGHGGGGPGGSTGGSAGGSSGGSPGLGGSVAGSSGGPAGAGGAPTGVAGGPAGKPARGTAGGAAGAGHGGMAGGAVGGSGGTAPGGRGGGSVAGAGGSASGGRRPGFGISGPTRCDTTLPLCESFETGLDATLWKTTKAGDATITVDDVHAARGTKALHIKTAAGGGSNFAYIKETKTFPATNNVLYGRMFVWFEDALTTDGHFTLAEGAGTGTPAVIRFGGQFKAFGVGTDGGSSGDWTDSDRSKLVPTKTWICAEFQFDGPTHTFHVWWDDMERPTLTSGPSKHASFTMPTFNGALVRLVDVQHRRAAGDLDRRDRRRLQADRLHEVAPARAIRPLSSVDPRQPGTRRPRSEEATCLVPS